MNDQKILDSYYHKYIKNIPTWLPDGLITINLDTLHHLNLLNFHTHGVEEANLTRYFQVTESDEKLTLVNEEFVVWIAPEKGKAADSTYTLVALNGERDLHLELGFVTRGVYNQSQLVLKILEKFLLEIHTTESVLKNLHG